MKIHDKAIPDEGWGGVEVAADDSYRWLIVRMGFNHRLYAIRHGSDVVEAEFGWCYANYQLALAAVIVFEPDTEDEPLFWHKRPGGVARRAPRRDKDPDYNRDRCIHGSYMDERCKIDEYCKR